MSGMSHPYSLVGYSGSDLQVIEESDGPLVRKSGNVTRNLERLGVLHGLGLPVPKILNVVGDSYDMEFIPNLSMYDYLLHQPYQEVCRFIELIIDTFQTSTVDYDYTAIYRVKLQKLDPVHGFDAETLIDKLPKILPKSPYHGDFTLDSILFDVPKKRFVLIDPLTTEYDSVVFDIAKLRQDLTCNWFMRHKPDNTVRTKLMSIESALKTKYPMYWDDTLLILMLLRVYPYAKTEHDRRFLQTHITTLWRSSCQ